jgi:hypothetical protein
MYKKLLLLCGIFTFAFNTPLKADTIGPSNCGSCLGSSYTLTYITTANPDAFNVQLVIDTSGFTNPTTDTLNAVALKVSSSNPTVTLLSGPTSFTSVMAGGLSASGCDGHGSGFFCSPSSGLGVPVGSPADVYTFDYLVTLASASDLFTNPLEASVKALYVDTTGKQNGITSEGITLQPGAVPPTVPEPSSIFLLGTGLLGLAVTVKRKLSSFEARN